MDSTYALNSAGTVHGPLRGGPEPEFRRASSNPEANHAFQNVASGQHLGASETALISAAKSGDQQAFVELCDRCGRFLKSRILRMVGNCADAEDAYQDTLLRAYQHLGSFRETCSFQTWITQIAINTALMVLRRRKIRAETSLEIPREEGQTTVSWEAPDPSPNPEQLYLKMQQSLILRKQISGLSPRSRQVVEHFHAHEKRMSEAADAAGISVGAAKSRLLRARAVLRRRLQRHIGGIRFHRDSQDSNQGDRQAGAGVRSILASQ